MATSSTLQLVLIACLLVPALLLFAFLNAQYLRDPPRRRTVVILVLGDIGRSPRMMYHAESFAKEGYEVRLLGYPGERKTLLLPE
jgi:beta-1,4-mannosyltransferase